MSEAAEKIAAIAEREGLQIVATFIPWSQSRHAKPWSQSRHAKPWKSLNWRVTLQRRGRDILTTDYGMGEAHCPCYSPSPDPRHPKAGTVDFARLRDWECENGRAGYVGLSGQVMSRSRGQTLAPPLVDVLAALARDADVLDEGGFENWAASLGYDTDSREAESVYRAWLEIALKLRAGLGADLLDELRDAASDY